jgi:hypothetical protein
LHCGFKLGLGREVLRFRGGKFGKSYSFLIEKDVGLLTEDDVEPRPAHEVVIAVVPLSIETFAVTEIMT